MLNHLVVGQLEPNSVSGFDIVRLGSSSRSSFVAAELLGVDDFVGEGRHVGVAVLADVAVVGSHGLAVDEQLGEDIVGIGQGRRQQRCGDCREVHLDGDLNALSVVRGRKRTN